MQFKLFLNDMQNLFEEMNIGIHQSTCTCVCKAVFVYYGSRQGMEGVIVMGTRMKSKATSKPDADPPMILTGWIKEHP
jgi:hypothetical protein